MLFVLKRALELDDVRMVECLQNFGLVSYLLLFSVRQVLRVDPLDHKVLASEFRAALEGGPVATLAKLANRLVLLSVLNHISI